VTGGQRLDEAATQLERDDPGLVADAVEQLRTGAEDDHRAGSPRGRSMVRRLRGVLGERPDLGLAVARQLDLEHIALDLLDGHSVDGVSGLAPDGTPLPTSREHRSKRRGAWMLAASGLILLLEAIVAGGVGSILLYLWTAVGLALFFVGGFLVMYRQ
jgi:hypothetical protein